jgi:hypothetical protein
MRARDRFRTQIVLVIRQSGTLRTSLTVHSLINVNGDVAPNFAQVSGTSTPFQQQDDDTIYLSIYLSSNTAKPLRMRIISWGQQNIHVANPKKKLIIINYLKLR